MKFVSHVQSKIRQAKGSTVRRRREARKRQKQKDCKKLLSADLLNLEISRDG